MSERRPEVCGGAGQPCGLRFRTWRGAGLVLAGLCIAALVATPASAQLSWVTTVAGQVGESGSVDGVGGAARFALPSGLAVDAGGNIYVGDVTNATVRRITPSGAVTVVAGASGVPGGDDGVGGAARFRTPRSLALDAQGNLYIADALNHTIRRMTPGGAVTTVAGVATASGAVDGTGSAARFWQPYGIAVAPGGTVYVADTGNNTIRAISPGGAVTTLAGQAGPQGYADGTGSAARFSAPVAVAVDAAGTLYVADNGNFVVRRITPGGSVTTLAGTAGAQGTNDGVGSAARFSALSDIKVDALGTVYVLDGSTIRKINPNGAVTTFLGKTSKGTTEGLSPVVRFFDPLSLAPDGNGGLVIADSGNHVVRRALIWPSRGGDFDGDGKTDATVFRPSTGTWYQWRSGSSPVGLLWGATDDVPVPGDYDGDGKTDVAVVRPLAVGASFTWVWYIIPSGTGQPYAVYWGEDIDIPVPADYDGDGKTDIAMYRPARGAWYIIQSRTNVAVSVSWGQAGDIPVPADYDGDGKADPTVFRPTTGTWYEWRSAAGPVAVAWGQWGDLPLAGDYDGDGKADPTVFRGGAGAWYELRSAGGGVGIVWGQPGDVPIVGDYDADGKDDPAIFRPSTSTWYQLRSSAGGFGLTWGAPGDLPF